MIPVGAPRGEQEARSPQIDCRIVVSIVPSRCAAQSGSRSSDALMQMSPARPSASRVAACALRCACDQETEALAASPSRLRRAASIARAHRVPPASGPCASGRTHPDPTVVAVTKRRVVQTSTVSIAERPSIDRSAMLGSTAAGLALRPSGWLWIDHTRAPHAAQRPHKAFGFPVGELPCLDRPADFDSGAH